MTTNEDNKLYPINIDGAQISSASVESIKFMQDENYVCSMISNVDEVIDIILKKHSHTVRMPILSVCISFAISVKLVAIYQPLN